MTENKSLEKMEKRLYLKYFQDGIWDMTIGMVLLLFGLMVLADMAYFIGAFVAALSFLPLLLKKKVTYPRLGFVKFRRKTVKRVKVGVFGVGLFLFLAGLIAFAGFGWAEKSAIFAWMREHFMWIIALIWGGALITLGVITQQARVYAFGALLMVSVVLADYVGSLGINMAVAGGLILLVGFWIMLRFIHKYPLQETPPELGE